MKVKIIAKLRPTSFNNIVEYNLKANTPNLKAEVSKSGKMTKTTSQQYELLINFLSKHQDLARGIVKARQGKIESTNLWKKVAEELNSIGPPVKSFEGWKKVYADYKMYVKSKLAKNSKNISGTGGGPCKLKHFSPLEEKLIGILNLKSAVSGLKESNSFGAPDSIIHVVNSEDVLIEEFEFVNPSGNPSEFVLEDGADPSSTENISSRQHNTRKGKSSDSYLETQINIQKKFYDEVTNSLKTLTQTQINLTCAVEKLVKIKEQEERSNYKMYKMICEKNEIKKQMLKLEEERFRLQAGEL